MYRESNLSVILRLENLVGQGENATFAAES
jgi:hypothetical protein